MEATENAPRKGGVIQNRPPRWKKLRVPSTARLIITRQLGALLGAGMPISRSLETLKDQSDSKPMKETMDGVWRMLGEGASLSGALAAFPRVFNKVYLSMVRVGETTGSLVESIDRLGDWLERDEKTAQKVRAAMTYPVLVILLGIGLMAAMFYYVMPVMVRMFENMNEELPAITRLMIWLTQRVQDPITWLAVIALVAEILYLLRERLSHPAGRLQIYRVLMSVPVLSPLLRYTALARMCTSMAAMLGVGVQLVNGFRLAIESSNNPLMEEEGNLIIEEIKLGNPMAESMAHGSFFPVPMINMVAAGEEAGNLEMMFERLGTYYEQEVNYRLEAFSAVLEPVLLMIVAAMVGTGLVSIFLPLYGLLGKLA